MPTVLHIDGFSADSENHFESKPGETLKDFLDRMGATWRLERVPDPPPVARKLTPDVAEYIASYEYEDPPAVLAVVRRYGWLDSEELDTAEEAQDFIENGEGWGSLAGEAVVDGDEITVWG